MRRTLSGRARPVRIRRAWRRIDERVGGHRLEGKRRPSWRRCRAEDHCRRRSAAGPESRRRAGPRTARCRIVAAGRSRCTARSNSPRGVPPPSKVVTGSNPARGERFQVGIGLALRWRAGWWVAPLPFLTRWSSVRIGPVTDWHQSSGDAGPRAMGLGRARGLPRKYGRVRPREPSACRISDNRTRWRCPPRTRSGRRPGRNVRRSPEVAPARPLRGCSRKRPPAGRAS